MAEDLDSVMARILSDSPDRSEADVQSDIKALLLCADLDVDEPKLEVSTSDKTGRRIDILAGTTVIEVKKKLSDSEVAKAEPQLRGYVEARVALLKGRYNGILTDGRQWRLYEVDPLSGEFGERSRTAVKTVGETEKLVSWLGSILATESGIAPDQATIEAKLGASSPAYAQDHAYLAGIYRAVADHPTVVLKRSLWARLLRSALGSAFTDREELFVDHTVLVIEAAVIAHTIMGFSAAELVADPAAMLSGANFAAADIHNAVDAGFFDWLLEHPDGGKFVTRLVQRIAVFDWAQAEHDVLKFLYESVVNAQTRKTLGEYYTPDWLAEAVIEQTVTEPLDQRVLDPSCGSGTFLFHAVRRYLAAADAAGVSNVEALDGVQRRVAGLDIHPVSVALARTTYLLALGERLTTEQGRGALTIPVYLGDAMQWASDASVAEDTIKIPVDGDDIATPALQPTLVDVARYLIFPLSSIDDPGTFDQLVAGLTDLAQSHRDSDVRRPDHRPVLNRFSIPARSEDGIVLSATFRLLCDLNAEGKNHIWGYFVRNQVRPLWFSMKGRKVDVLVGNPPWVSFRFMTEAMQTQFRRFSYARGLWHGKNFATHQDLVALFIARTCQLYLTDGGQFGFLTPLALLSRKQYEGFRSGNWGGYERGEITQLWDLDRVRPSPFPVPAAAVFGIHHNYDAIPFGSPTGPPHGTPSDKISLVGPTARTWEKTKKQLTYATQVNVVTAEGDKFKSSYGAMAFQGAIINPRYQFFILPAKPSSKLGHAATKTPVESLRTADEKMPWKSLPSMKGSVESRFIHQVLLGSTIAPFRVLTPWSAVLPISGGEVLDSQAISNHPGLSAWWNHASMDWDTHKSQQAKTARMSLMGQLDYMSKLSKQLGGAKHRIIYSRSGNTLAAARIEDPRYIIDQTLYWIPAKNINEAYYLTAVLNSGATTQAVSAYQSRGLFGARDFAKYVWMLPIPTFDSSDELHNQIASLGQQAEQLAELVELPKESRFQTSRKIIRAELQNAGLTAQLDTAVLKLFSIES